MSRILERDKPKLDILEGYVKGYFRQNPECNKAIIEIKEDKLTRSGAQNDLYWAWVDVLRRELGYHKDEMHKVLVDAILGYDTVTRKDGKVISNLVETKKLKVGDFKVFLDEVEILAAKQGIMLPHDDRSYNRAMGNKSPTQGA